MDTKLERDLNERAWNDEAFRRELLSNPKQTIEKMSGRTLPGQTRVSVLEDTADTIHFVLRRKPVADTGEISDEALGNVAGGFGGDGPALSMNKHLSGGGGGA